MSTTDRTGVKLVDSMRKTKAAAADKSGAPHDEAPGEGREPQRPNTGAEHAARRPDGEGSRRDDPYQGGRRIWPD